MNMGGMDDVAGRHGMDGMGAMDVTDAAVRRPGAADGTGRGLRSALAAASGQERAR